MNRFSRKTRLLQSIDRRIGVPVCWMLTAGRRIARLFGGRTSKHAEVGHIVFIKLAEQGSTVLAWNALRLAVDRVGREHVFFFCFEENRFIVDVLGVIPPENVVVVRTRSFGSMVASALRGVVELRRRGVDVAIDLEFFARASAVLAFLSGACVRVGFHTHFAEGPYRGDLFTHRVLYNAHLHTSATFRSLVQALDEDPARLPAFVARSEGVEMDLSPVAFAPAESTAVRCVLDESGVPSGSRLVVLNANASDLLPLRRWDGGNYVALAKRLLAAFPDVCVVFTGASEEEPAIAQLVRAVDDARCITLAGRTTLRELLVLFSLGEVLVTNDSGPAHFAALTPIDVVALFGPETPLLFGVLGPRSHPLTAGLACSPCVNAYNNRQTICRDNQCMKAIVVDDVFEVVSGILAKRKSRRA